MSDINDQIWRETRQLTATFWESYDRLFKRNPTKEPAINSIQTDTDSEEDPINPEYEEFVRVTREHRLERDRLKKIEQERDALKPEEYYTDLSDLNTLVVDNQIKIPDPLQEMKQEPQFFSDEIKSMEMCIDEVFKTKCQELAPKYWPIIPINPKPYLNPIKN